MTAMFSGEVMKTTEERGKRVQVGSIQGGEKEGRVESGRELFVIQILGYLFLIMSIT